jgi:hypothetical protein
MNRVLLAVGTLLSLPSLGRLTLTISFSGTPEAGPGTMISTPALTPNHSSTATSSSSPSSGGSSNVGFIAGGVTGGLVAGSAVTAIVFIFLRRRTTKQGPPVAAMYGGSPQPLMGQVHSPPPNDGAFVRPSLPMTPTTPVKLYVRVSTFMSQSLCPHLCPLFSICIGPE